MQGGTRGGQRHGTREALVSSPPQTPRAPPLLEPPWEEVLRRASLQWGDGMGHADELLHGRRHTELDRVREVRHGSLPSHPSRAASPRTQPTLLGVYAACHAVRPSLPPSLLPRLLQVLRSHLPLLREAFGRFADTPGLAATVEAGGKLPLEMGATGERAEAGGPSAPKGHRQMSLGQFWRLLHESRLEPDGMPPALPAAEFSEDFEPLDEGRLEAHMRARAKAHTHVPPLPPPGPLRELVTAHHPLRAGGLAHVVRALLRAAGGGSSLELASTPLPHERFGRLLTHHVQPMMQRLAPPPPYQERTRPYMFKFSSRLSRARLGKSNHRFHTRMIKRKRATVFVSPGNRGRVLQVLRQQLPRRCAMRSTELTAVTGPHLIVAQEVARKAPI